MPAMVATATASIWTHRPTDPPAPPAWPRSNSRSAAPLANSPKVRNTPARIAVTGVHHQRPTAISATGMSWMKNTGGTVGYGWPDTIWITTPAVATSSAAMVSLPADDTRICPRITYLLSRQSLPRARGRDGTATPFQRDTRRSTADDSPVTDLWPPVWGTCFVTPGATSAPRAPRRRGYNAGRRARRWGHQHPIADGEDSMAVGPATSD